MGVETAIIGGSLIGGGLSWLSAKESSKGAKQAASAQREGADAATAAQLEMYYQGREDLAPWREAGVRSLADLERVQGTYEGAIMDPSQYQQSPGYGWLEQQGREAINRQSAAQGMFGTGRHSKDLMQYGQGLALQDYQGYLGRLESLMNRYAGTSNVGQTTSGQLAGLGANTANQIGANAIYSGQASGVSQINQANSRTGLYQNLSNIGTSATNQYMLNNYLNQLGTQQQARVGGFPNVETIRGGQYTGGGGYGF